jgi:hypothetical protein
VGVWATSTRPGAVGGSPIAAAATSTSSGGGRSTAARVLDVAQELQELGGLAVGGGDGEPANHVLEAGERALVAVAEVEAVAGATLPTGRAPRLT